MGDAGLMAGTSGDKKMMEKLLIDPQQLNSYSYARNNPIINRDSSGNVVETILDVGLTTYDVGNTLYKGGQFIKAVFSGDLQKASNASNAFLGSFVDLGYDAGATLVPFLPAGLTKVDDATKAVKSLQSGESLLSNSSGAIAAGIATGLTGLSSAYLGGAGTACVAMCGQGQKSIDYTAQFGSQLGSQMNQVSKNLGKNSGQFSTHAIQRIAQRIGVGNENTVLSTLKKQPFEYLHDGASKMGYYDAASRIFVGQIKDTGKITTVITNASQKYVNNLRSLTK